MYRCSLDTIRIVIHLSGVSFSYLLRMLMFVGRWEGVFILMFENTVYHETRTFTTRLGHVTRQIPALVRKTNLTR